MDLSFKLIFFREYKNWQPEDVAKEPGLWPESYKNLEKGRAKLNGIPAQKLPDLYQAPIAFFYRRYTALRKEEVKGLKQQIEKLNRQNAWLVE